MEERRYDIWNNDTCRNEHNCDTQNNNTQHNNRLQITTLSIMELSVKGLNAAPSIMTLSNGLKRKTQHYIQHSAL